jgi:hypothetical protein
MSTTYATILSTLCVATGLATAVAGQQPRILNGRVNAQPAGSLQQTFKTAVSAQTEIAWIGYSVPVSDRNWGSCCWSSADGTTYMSGSFRDGNMPCCGSCRLDPASGPATTTRQATAPGTTPAGPVKLEGGERMVVLFRIADRQVERIRSYSEDCELDAGGRQVTWLQDVRPAESVALLESMIGADVDKRSRVANGALSAMAMHAEPSAAAALERLARSHASSSIRAESLFWIGQRSDPNAERTILQALEKDQSTDVKKKAVFALSQIKDDGGVEALIRAARTHQDASIRGEAIFWLSQKAGRKAAGTITEAIEKDPETDVKKRAVFALSQLPTSEGVPLLIDIARKNPNPVVRKQAIFWLGQSKDPRALEFFAQILK